MSITTDPTELVLPSSYEEILSELKNKAINEVMIDFFVPLPDMEVTISELSTRVRSSGKVSFIFGKPGVGKSTFIQSLSWRKNIKISDLKYFNAHNFSKVEKLDKIIAQLNFLSKSANDRKDKGPLCFVINYLESLSGLDDDLIKGFFRDLNGVLRSAPFLILWPLTEESDIEKMLSYSSAVSGTIFNKGYEIINFKGPSLENFCDIATKTIEVINGKALSEFNLNTKDLEDVKCNFMNLAEVEQTIRLYLEMVRKFWEVKNEYFKKITNKIPKPNEVWFVFVYKNAESVVKQFVRQSEHSENAWVAIHEKLYEYIRENDQRKSIWDSSRLQLAINGVVKSRILFMSTNAFIMAVNSYTDNDKIKEELATFDLNRNWSLKHKAQEAIGRTPLVRLLLDEYHPVGKKKGSQTESAILTADAPFKRLNHLISSKLLSDSHLNKAMAACIADCTRLNPVAESPHPWIPSIRPDIFIDTPNKQICIEFHYTDKEIPSEIADYVLRKLNLYMNQLESYSGQGILF